MSTGPCPCGGADAYERCCGPVHGGAPAASAEALMRSRYSGFALGLTDHLLASWHPRTRPATLDLDDAAGRRTVWLGLTIRDSRQTGPDSAEVEFVARFRVGGDSATRLRERSRFVREQGRWYYLDGDIRA